MPKGKDKPSVAISPQWRWNTLVVSILREVKENPTWGRETKIDHQGLVHSQKSKHLYNLSRPRKDQEKDNNVGKKLRRFFFLNSDTTEAVQKHQTKLKIIYSPVCIVR